MMNEMTRLSDQLIQMAEEGRSAEELVATLQSVDDPSALLQFDDFDSAVGEALSIRARELGAPSEVAVFLVAKGCFFEGDMAAAAELLNPLAHETKDLRLLHLWAQIPDSAAERTQRLLLVVERVGNDARTWELIKFNAERAGMEDVHSRAIDFLDRI